MLAIPELSVILPAYNEEKRLGQTLRQLGDYLTSRKIPHEIIVVDDGSSDGTSQMAEKLHIANLRVIKSPENQGKGAAIQRGVAEARGKWVLFSDADLSTPIEEYEKLARAMKEKAAGVAIASRDLPGAIVHPRQPIYRELMGKAFNLLVQLLVLPGIHDTQCGFKLFETQAAKKIFSQLTIKRFGFDVEILYIARKSGNCIVEVPVTWHNVLGSKVSPWRDALTMFADLLRIRWRHRDLKPAAAQARKQ